MEKRIVGMMSSGHGTSWSEMEREIDEPKKSSFSLKQWMISEHQQSLKSKVDTFSAIVSSPLQCLETHDDVSPPNTDFACWNTTLYSVRDDFNNNPRERHSSNGKPRNSTSSQVKVLDKHTKTDSKKVIIPLGRQEFQSYEQVPLCSEDKMTESAVHRIQNCISNEGLQFSSDPVECLTAISPPDFPSARHGFSLDPNVMSPDLDTEASPSSNCNFSSEGTQVLSAEVLGFCTLKERNADGQTGMCSVEYLLHDKKEKDLGKVRNVEGVKEITIQKNAEEGMRMPEDSANAAPPPGLSPFTPVDSSCHAAYGEAPQTQHKALRSRGSTYIKGPHAGKTEEVAAGVMSARRSVSKTKTEMETIEKLRVGVKGAKEKKEKKKTGNERMQGQLTFTRPTTRGRVPKAIPELLIKVPHANLDTRGKVERKSPNKATRICKLGVVSETESLKEGEKGTKSPEHFVAAPVMGKRLINISALDITSYCDYSSVMRGSNKTEVTLNTCVNKSQTRRSKTMGDISCGLSSSVHAHSSSMGKTLSEAELESAAAVDGGMCSSKHSMTQSAKTTSCMEREVKEGGIKNRFGAQELIKRPELGVQSRGRKFYQNRKRRMESQSLGSPQCSDVHVAQSEMAALSLGDETSGQGNGLYDETTQQRGNYNNGIVKDTKEEAHRQDTGRVTGVVNEDEEGIVCSRDFQGECVPEQETRNYVKNYLKEACKLRPVSVQGKQRDERNTSSKSNLASLMKEGQLHCTVNQPSNIHLGSDVGCNDVKGNATRHIYLPVQAETEPLIPGHRLGKSQLMQKNKETNEEGGTTPILSVPSIDTSSKSKKSSRKAGTCRRNSHSKAGKDAPVVVKEPQRHDNLKISGSIPLKSCRKRRHSCPEIKPPPHSPRTAHMLASSPFGKLPCSAVYHFPDAHPRPSPVKRARRHTVCSLEVEREVVPLCLRKEVYPVGWGRLCGCAPHLCPNLTTSPKALAACFLASPQAFLSSKCQNGSDNIASSCGNSHKDTSSSSCSFATPTPSCPVNSSVCHPLFPATTSSVASVHQSSASVFSFCSVPSLRDDEQKLEPEYAEENSCFGLELDAQERREEKSLSDSEIKMESMKQRELGKVSQIKIRRTPPKPANNLTPMGLPKPVRLKKKEFSLEEIYTNKNFHEPPDGRLETIFEVPISGRDGSVSVAGLRRIKRFVEFPEIGMPRKPRKPVIRSGVSRKAVESSNLARSRRGGSDRTKESCILTLQEIEGILCSKLEQLDTWIALDEDVLSV